MRFCFSVTLVAIALMSVVSACGNKGGSTYDARVGGAVGSPNSAGATVMSSAGTPSRTGISGVAGVAGNVSMSASAGMIGTMIGAAGLGASASGPNAGRSASAGMIGTMIGAAGLGASAPGPTGRGAPITGTAGAATAGMGATGASGTSAVVPAGPGDPAGCSAAMVQPECSATGMPCSIDVSGMMRTYYVSLPANYDKSRKYPLVFQFHPLGGSAEGARTMYNIKAGMPDAIYVSPQGLSSGGSAGWPNTGGQDVAFTKAMIDKLQATYCVDKARIFSTGFSYGGMMSVTIACQMGDIFRAVGIQSGFPTAPCKPTHPIAVWQTQGDQDPVVTPANAAMARDTYIKLNHCMSTTKPVEPMPCVSYDGCDAGYPVVWCSVAGEGHAIPRFSSSAIAAFFKQF